MAMDSSPIVTGDDPVTVGDDTGDGPTRKGEGGDGSIARSAAAVDTFAESDVHIVLDGGAARRAVTALLTSPIVGLDTETTGLDPRTQRVRLVQVATSDGHVYLFDLFRQTWPQLWVR